MALKSYMILDAESSCRASLNRLAGMAKRLFEVPVVAVCLVDVGSEIGMNMFMSKPVTMNDLNELQTNADVVALREILDQLEHQREECDTVNVKRRKITPSGRRMSSIDTTKTCLVCSDEANVPRIRELVENQGWKAVATCTVSDAISLLKSRNWDAVVWDAELCCGHSAAVPSVKNFRDWEQKNRIHRQRDLYLMSTGFVSEPDSSSSVALVQVPPGFDDAVSKLPPKKNELVAWLLHKAQ